MKNTIITVLVTACVTALCTYFITSSVCTKPAPGGIKTHESAFIVSDTASLDTVSLTIAQSCVANLNFTWDTMFHVNTGCPIQAFTIHAADLLAALGLPPGTQCVYPNIRVYLGLTLPPSKFKLYVVAADSLPNCPYCGPDHLFDVNGTSVSVDPKAEGGNYVMDLNAPCPFTCDAQSPLYYPATGNQRDSLHSKQHGSK